MNIFSQIAKDCNHFSQIAKKRNHFSQIVRDCKEFKLIPATLFTINVVSSCILLKGVVLTFAAASLLSVIAGVALSLFGAAILLNSLLYSGAFLCTNDAGRINLREPGGVVKGCKFITLDITLNNRLSLLLRQIYYRSE